MSKNLSELAGRKGVVDTLFEKMGQAAQADGSPSHRDLEELAEEFLIGKANTYGATTFYDFMKPENRGKKVYICNGTACLCAGKQNDLKKLLETKIDPGEIGHMTCLGRCHENGAFQYNGQNFSGLSNVEILELISRENTPGPDQYAVGSNKAIITLPYEGFEKHYGGLKEILKQGPKAILEEIKTSGIRGRGGAGFPMGFKLEACAGQPGKTKFIICNADEGDPGAYSDRFILEQRPHSLLYGMLLAGFAIGAEWGIVYIRGEYPESVKIVNQAIRELRKNQLLGKNILGTDLHFDLKVIRAQGAYICGEETALLNSIEGQRPEVRTRPPYPTTQGLFNKPTVVNNVETLAALPYILTKGGSEYKKIGAERSSGTKLMSLDSFFNKPGIYEVEMGTPLSEVLYEMAGGFKAPVKALHIGGPLGGIVPIDKIPELTVDFESFAKNGFLLGHASVVCIPEDFPMMQYLEHLFEFAAFESCGKCFPCRLGTKRAQELLHRSMNSDYRISNELFEDLLNTLEKGSLCAHGGGIPLPARNVLKFFKEELHEYFEN